MTQHTSHVQKSRHPACRHRRMCRPPDQGHSAACCACTRASPGCSTPRSVLCRRSCLWCRAPELATAAAAQGRLTPSLAPCLVTPLQLRSELFTLQLAGTAEQVRLRRFEAMCNLDSLDALAGGVGAASGTDDDGGSSASAGEVITTLGFLAQSFMSNSSHTQACMCSRPCICKRRLTAAGVQAAAWHRTPVTPGQPR